MSKSKKSSDTSLKRTFRDYLVPEFVSVCNDVIVAQDQTVSLIRLIDQLNAFFFPLHLVRFVVVVQFQRDTTIDINELVAVAPHHKLILVTPKGENLDLGDFGLALDPKAPWFTTRS